MGLQIKIKDKGIRGRKNKDGVVGICLNHLTYSLQLMRKIKL